MIFPVQRVCQQLHTAGKKRCGVPDSLRKAFLTENRGHFPFSLTGKDRLCPCLLPYFLECPQFDLRMFYNLFTKSIPDSAENVKGIPLPACIVWQIPGKINLSSHCGKEVFPVSKGKRSGLPQNINLGDAGPQTRRPANHPLVKNSGRVEGYQLEGGEILTKSQGVALGQSRRHPRRGGGQCATAANICAPCLTAAKAIT